MKNLIIFSLWFFLSCIVAAQMLVSASPVVVVDPLARYYLITNEQAKQNFDLAEECCATRSWKSNRTHPCQVITSKGGKPSPVTGMSNDRVSVIKFIYRHLVSTRQNGPVNPNLDNGFIMLQSQDSAEDYSLVEECYYDYDEWKQNYAHQCQWIIRKCDFPTPRVPDMSYQRLVTLRAIYQNYMDSEHNDRDQVYECFHKHSNKEHPDCLGITWNYPSQSGKNTYKTRRQQHREQLYRGLYRLDYLSGICTLMPEEEPDCKDYFRAMQTNTTPHPI